MSRDTLKIKRTRWAEDRERLAAIRRQVFIDEQGVPEDMEWDEYDATATHYIATIGDDVVACARLKSDGQLGRMAVILNRRRQGIGGKVLRYILDDAATMLLPTITLHAQVSAIPFYEKFGFVCRGEQFDEAGIQHREMALEKR